MQEFSLEVKTLELQTVYIVYAYDYALYNFVLNREWKEKQIVNFIHLLYKIYKFTQLPIGIHE